MSTMRGGELASMTAIMLIGGLLLWTLLSGGSLPVERSALGSRGLVSWLRGEDQQISYPGFAPVLPGSVGLRIIPVLDTDLGREFTRPADDREWLLTGTERDLSGQILTRKVELLPTLVIAPKWTRAVRYTGLAHDSLLLDAAEAGAPLSRFGAWEGELLRPGDVLRFEVDGREGLLYQPQLFPAALDTDCAPVLSAGPGHLLIRCERAHGPVWLLSDPDLMNNHGLRLAENAAIAAAELERMSGGKPMLLDNTNFILVQDQTSAPDARSWAELGRFFVWPYALAWVGLAALTVLLLWRSWVRLGPAQRLFDDQLGPARTVSITAKARILRMAGNDPRLLAAHVENRLRRIERKLFGNAGSADPVERITTFIGRKDPDLAGGFKQAAATAMTPATGTPPAQLLTLLDAFERQAQRVLNGSG
ncbi:hypothetical protein ACW9UR_01980 [Halovulum sp. GXIMD14794]